MKERSQEFFHLPGWIWIYQKAPDASFVLQPPAGSRPRGCEGSFSPEASCTWRKSIFVRYRISERRRLVHPQNFQLILFLSELWLGGKGWASSLLQEKWRSLVKMLFPSPRLSIELEDSDFSLEWGRCGWPWAEMRLQNNGTIVGAARGGSRVWL